MPLTQWDGTLARLRVMIDLVFFVAEHDDHHLAIMRELAQEAEEASGAH